jgi:hypothetical protein
MIEQRPCSVDKLHLRCDWSDNIPLLGMITNRIVFDMFVTVHMQLHFE